ncbi:S-methyl-5-thioribose-1-phosphate isomerase [Streptomycetaceae bacterium NBC_01309]
MAIEVRSLAWHGKGLHLIDQTALPREIVRLDVTDVDTLIDAIRRLAVRGAPALGASGAFGVAIAMLQAEREQWGEDTLRDAIRRIRDARPTAVNLAGGVDRVLPLVPQGVAAVVAEAEAVVREDVAANKAIGANGADWILARVERRPLRVLTHCNTGSLATAGWGTALGIIRELHERGVLEVVYADETRPLLQGSRLTAWELDQEGIPHFVQPDGAAASTILRGLVDVAVIGADRIAANGDTANKIGSVGVALACADAGVPFVVAAPQTTFDPATPHGDAIEIEERPEAEVLEWGGIRVAPEASRAFNPAFDVTPARLISAIVSELGVTEPRA